MTTVKDLTEFLSRMANLSHAASWDNVGLILGRGSEPVRRVMTCLTVTPAVVAEAIAEQVNLIVSHHPMMFRPVQKLNDTSVEGRMLLDLAAHRIAVFSAHTAFDNCPNGINERLAQRLGLTEVRPLRPRNTEPKFKIVVFVPEGDLIKVSDALFSAGAGNIGQYSQCSFRLSGTGTFFGNESATPTIGEKGRREEVEEWRLEAVCPDSQVSAAMAAIRRAHSYEEPAFDVYPLRVEASAEGEGRIGRLPVPVRLEVVAAQIRTELRSGPIQVVGQLTRLVQTIALACGAAGEFLNDAARLAADVFLTGELRFHDLLTAQAANLAVVLPGHYSTERFAMEELASTISTEFPALTAIPSVADQDPVNWV